MAFTNSPLATVKVLSPNHSGQRTHEIDTITIHCVVGQCTAKRIGEIFLPESRQASSNYGIGYDGEIGLYVEEKTALGVLPLALTTKEQLPSRSHLTLQSRMRSPIRLMPPSSTLLPTSARGTVLRS